MKNRILLAITFSLFVFHSAAIAQDAPSCPQNCANGHFGLMGGGNFQRISNSSTFNDRHRSGYLGGIYLGVSGKWVGIEADLLVTSARYTYNEVLSFPRHKDINVVYINMPVLLQVKTVLGIWVEAGPQVGDIIRARSAGEDRRDMFDYPDFSGVVGLSKDFSKVCSHACKSHMGIGRLKVGVRYSWGFADINDHDNTYIGETWKDNSIQAYIAIGM